MENFFRTRRRFDVTLDSLKQGYSHDPSACLAFMSDDAFAFFLPAFMKISLEDYDRADVIPEVVIGKLKRMGEGADGDRRDAVLRQYVPQQVRAIVDFLAEMSSRYWHAYPEDSARKALEFWSQMSD